MNLTEMTAQVRNNLRDLGASGTSQLIADDNIEPYVLEAVNRYSNDRPVIEVAEATADGTLYLALPANYEDGWSTIRAIQWPVDDTLTPTLMDSRAFSIFPTPTGNKIIWLDNGATPSSADDVRIHFTKRHEVDADSSTIPLAHDYAVIDLATSFACEAIAARYASTVENTFGGDTAGYRSKQQEWTAIANRYRDRYKFALRNNDSPASGRVNWDTRDSLGNPRINHPSPWR